MQTRDRRRNTICVPAICRAPGHRGCTSRRPHGEACDAPAATDVVVRIRLDWMKARHSAEIKANRHINRSDHQRSSLCHFAFNDALMYLIAWCDWSNGEILEEVQDNIIRNIGNLRTVQHVMWRAHTICSGSAVPSVCRISYIQWKDCNYQISLTRTKTWELFTRADTSWLI